MKEFAEANNVKDLMEAIRVIRWRPILPESYFRLERESLKPTVVKTDFWQSALLLRRGRNS